MLVNDKLQEVIDGSIAEIQVDGLLDLDHVRTAASLRDRRQRVMGGLATAAFALLVVVSVGVFGMRDDPSAVFAGVEAESLMPMTAVRGDGGLAGLASAERLTSPDEDATWAVVWSGDGEAWELVEGAPTFIGRNVVLDERNGRFTVVLLKHIEREADETGGSAELTEVGSETWMTFTYATSNDLVTWQQIDFVVASTDVGIELADTFLTSIASFPDRADGVVVGLRTFNRSLTLAFDELGLDQNNICQWQPEDDQLRARLCGESEFQLLPQIRFGSPDARAVRIAPTGIELVELPISDPQQWRSLPLVSAFPTEDGVGLAGYRVYESTDGAVWHRLPADDRTGIMYAPRGSEAVYRTPLLARRFGPEDSVWGMGYTNDDGESWQDIRISELVGEEPVATRYFSDLVASDGGWAFQASYEPDELLPLDERPEPGSGSTEFEFEADGFVLTGALPYGPAQLVDGEGAVVHQWDWFEPLRPEWNGLDVSFRGVAIPLQSGEVVTFPLGPFDSLNLEITLDEERVYELLYSANGTDWSVLTRTDRPAQILDVAPDFVTVVYSSPIVASQPTHQVVRIPTSGAG
jgi:hypothetical protein